VLGGGVHGGGADALPPPLVEVVVQVVTELDVV